MLPSLPGVEEAGSVRFERTVAISASALDESPDHGSTPSPDVHSVEAQRADRGREALDAAHLCPFRVSITRLTTSRRRHTDGSPLSVSVVFEIVMNDGHTRWRAPIRVDRAQALKPGEYAEPGDLVTPDYLYAAWCALAKVGRALSQTIEGSHPPGDEQSVQTMLERWAQFDPEFLGM